MNVNVMATYPSMKLAVSDRVGNCCRGSRESHSGFKWSYVEEKGTR